MYLLTESITKLFVLQELIKTNRSKDIKQKKKVRWIYYRRNSLKLALNLSGFGLLSNHRIK